jgi:hypothetical protein
MSDIVYLLDERSHNNKDWLFGLDDMYIVDILSSVHGAQRNHECVSADARICTDMSSTIACTRSCHTHLISPK